jgi:ubiquinone/menaquinone biosynthesis C-methylase UbiE
MKKTLMYSKLARHYDKMHHFFNYKKQVEFILKNYKKHNKSQSKRVLDVACGTGIHASMLSKRGFEVTGVDISREMLEQARKKGGKVRYILMDMRKLSLNERFDLITCMYNSILYNVNKNQLRKTLVNFYNHLEKGGMLIFDAFDKTAGINEKKFLYELKGDTHIISVYITRFNRKEDILEFDNYFIINGKLFHDYHHAGSFTREQIAGILESVGFEVILIDKKKGVMSHTYVCRK